MGGDGPYPPPTVALMVRIVNQPFRTILVACVAAAALAAGGRAAHAQVLAFPEAEGFGRFATGARTNLPSASVYRVTNLNDTGAGSFRDAVSQPNRFVVFDVGGVVTLGSVAVVSSNVTIAGQTAPGGIALYGDRLAFTGAHNTISRYIAVRKGEAGTREDTVNLSRGTNIIFDHMSVTWGVDETFSMNPATGEVIDNITIQNTVIAQGLDRLGHSAGGLMTLGEGSRFSIIKSLFADNVTRNPKVRGENEFINNVVYGYETAGYIMGDTVNMASHANAIGNYFIEGPVDGSSPFASGTPQFEMYGSDNWVDANRNGVLDGSRITTYPGATVAATPFAFPTTASMTAAQAVGYVTQNAGPMITRDEVDTRIMQEVLSYGTLGGVILRDTDLFPTFTSPRIAFGRLTDTDNDGMPDGWERSRGLNPASSTDWKTVSGGYTNLELYLNELGASETTSQWTAASGSWGATANWSGGLPTFATTAAVNGTTVIASGQGLTRRLTIGDATASQVTVSGGTLDVFERLHVGSGATGALTITAGTVAAGELVLGGTSGATPTSGILTMTGGTLQAAFVRAGSAQGRFDWNGGAVQFSAAPDVSVATVLGAGGGTLLTNGFSGTWSGAISGGGGLTKNGAGTLALSGSNTMTEGVKVMGGTLAVNHVAAIGSGSITLAGGNATFGSVSGITRPIAVLSSGTISAGGITLNGPISGGSSVRLAVATSATGNSNLTLAGGFTGFSGTVDFNATTGNVRLNSTAALGSSTARFDLGSSTATVRTAFAASVALGALAGGTATKLQGSTNDSGLVTYVVGGNGASTTFGGTITDGVFTTPGRTALTKVGAGTLVLGGGSSTYSGVTRISGGVLSVGTLTNGGTASSIGQATADPANLVLDGGTLQYTGAAITIDRGFTVTANGGTLERNGPGSLVLGGTTDIVMSGTGDRTFTLSGTATSFNNITNGIPDAASGRTTLVKSGPGTWRLFGGAKTYSGDTLVNGGTLFLVSAGVLPTGVGKGDVTLAAGTTLDLYGNSHTINGLDGAGTVTTTLNTTRTLTLGNGDASGNFSGLLTQGTSQTLAITKIGSGTQRLGVSSNYAGGTALRGGTLVAAANDALGSGLVTVTGSAQRLTITGSATIANAVFISGPTGATDGGTIHYDGPGRGILAGGTITMLTAPANGGLFGSSGGGELVINAPVVVQGAARVSVRTGAVTFGGGGTYAGLDVMQGTVRLGRTNGLATGASVTIGTTGPGTLDLAGYDQLLAGIAQGAGAAVIGTSSTTQDARLTLTGSSTYAGTICDAIGGGSRRVSLVVNGGNLRLTGANPFTGTSSVTAGTLQAGHSAALASSSIAVLATGTLAIDAGLAMQTPSLTIASGGLARLSPSIVTVVATSGLVIDGRLELGAGRFEIAAGGITQDSLLAALVGGRGDGTWTATTGITSAAAAADLATNSLRTVGWLENNGGSFSVAFTAPGDTNLDGQIDILDAANFLVGGKFDTGLGAIWSEGDFNYDQVVDILDTADFFSTELFNQGPFLPVPAPGAVAVVPEPTGLPLLALAACVAVAFRRRMVRTVASVGAACMLVALSTSAHAVPAVPGATGFGASSTGGRGGDVYHVTTLANDPGRTIPGSLAYGLSSKNVPAAGRTIVFDVGGTIDLSSGTSATLDLKDIRRVTVAGQTAPSLVTIIGNTVQITGNTVATPTNDLIFQHIAIRKGTGGGDDALSIKGTGNTHDIFVSNVSGCWSEDEVISATQTATNVTVQDSIMAEALTASHAYGALIRPTVNSQISYNQNLFANQQSRNPRPGTYNGMTLDFEFQNNVIYNWVDRAGYIAGADSTIQYLNMNYVGNYLVAGPVPVNTSSNPTRRNTAFLKEMNASPLAVGIYQEGNKIDSNYTIIRDGTDTSWGMFQQSLSGTYSPLALADRQATRFAYPDSTPDTADNAYAKAIATSGAMPWARSPIDKRIIDTVLTFTGTAPITAPNAAEWASLTSGSVTTRPAGWDTDGDGMPNAWEAKRGTNPNVADNNGFVAGNDYTNLENYLNSLSAQAVWYPDADGGVANFMNWRGDRPSSAWSVAAFGDVITARRTVTLDVALSVQDLTFDSPRGYVLSGTRSLTFDALSGYATLTVASGSHVIAAPVVLADAATFTVSSGSASVSFTGGITAGGRTITKAGPGSVSMPSLAGAGLAVTEGSVRLASAASTVSSLTSLVVSDTAAAALDLGAGSVTVAPGGMTTSALLVDLLAGRRGGSWDGPGIRSSLVAAQVATGLPRALGWMSNSDGSLTASYAAPGDTNVDGLVDVLDAANFSTSGKFDFGTGATWFEGDFNYDGVVDVLDAADFINTNLFDAGPYGSQAPLNGVAAVPEPAFLLPAGGLIVATTTLMRVQRPRRFGR